jgi:hypothetical protein
VDDIENNRKFEKWIKLNYPRKLTVTDLKEAEKLKGGGITSGSFRDFLSHALY